MLFEDRISLILKLIETQGSIENSKIIKDLKISEATLRRDLAYLEKENKIKRVRGGAVLRKVARKEIELNLPRLKSQGSWVVVASVSQLNLPSYPHSSYGSYIVYLSTYP